jgi:hypothetical protein
VFVFVLQIAIPAHLNVRPHPHRRTPSLSLSPDHSAVAGLLGQCLRKRQPALHRPGPAMPAAQNAAAAAQKATMSNSSQGSNSSNSSSRGNTQQQQQRQQQYQHSQQPNLTATAKERAAETATRLSIEIGLVEQYQQQQELIVQMQ